MKHFELKLGNMRKAQDFIVYPRSYNEQGPEPTIFIQSDKRCAEINTETGEGLLSTAGGHPGFLKLSNVFNPLPIKVDMETVALLTDSQPKSGDKIGHGVYVA